MEVATRFIKAFKEFINAKIYEEEFISNADETGLFCLVR